MQSANTVMPVLASYITTRCRSSVGNCACCGYGMYTCFIVVFSLRCSAMLSSVSVQCFVVGAIITIKSIYVEWDCLKMPAALYRTQNLTGMEKEKKTSCPRIMRISCEVNLHILWTKNLRSRNLKTGVPLQGREKTNCCLNWVLLRPFLLESIPKE